MQGDVLRVLAPCDGGSGFSFLVSPACRASSEYLRRCCDICRHQSLRAVSWPGTSRPGCSRSCQFLVEFQAHLGDLRGAEAAELVAGPVESEVGAAAGAILGVRRGFRDLSSAEYAIAESGENRGVLHGFPALALPGCPGGGVANGGPAARN